MAEERDDSQRSDEPTQRSLDEAHKKGEVVKSSDLASFVMLAGGALALLLFSGAAAGEFRVFLENPAEINLDAGSASALFQRAVFGLFASLAPSVGLMLVAALAGHFLQYRPVLSAGGLKPALS